MFYMCRRYCVGEAEFWPQLHSCDCGLSSAEWEVSGRYGSGQVDPSPLIPGGLPCRRTLHTGVCLCLRSPSFSHDHRWCSCPVCVLGGAVWVGQQLYTGSSDIHQLSAEETGTGSYAMEEDTTRGLKQGGKRVYTLGMYDPASIWCSAWCCWCTGSFWWLDCNAEYWPCQRGWIQTAAAVWGSQGLLTFVILYLLIPDLKHRFPMTLQAVIAISRHFPFCIVPFVLYLTLFSSV